MIFRLLQEFIFGGLIYAWQAYRINKIESNANDKISSLEQQIANLQTKLNDATKLTNSMYNKATKDNSVVMKTYSNDKFTLIYPEEYTIEETTDSLSLSGNNAFDVLVIQKDENRKMEIFREGSYDTGLSMENPSEEDLKRWEEWVEETISDYRLYTHGELMLEAFLWLPENDKTTEEEMLTIFNSIKEK